MKFCECGKMFNMLDDLEQRVLYHHCPSCNIKIPFESNLIYSKQNIQETAQWSCYDKSLPVSEKKCYKCQGLVIYEKKSDLTLIYTCTKCHERWY